MPKPQPFASPEFVTIKVWNHVPVVYPTDPPGGLAVGEGEVALRYRLDFDHGGKPDTVAEGGANVACFQRVADAAGTVWECRTCFRPHLFVHRMLDLDSLEWPMWDHNTPDRAASIAERPLLTGLGVVADDRFYRRFWVNDALVEVQFKYQGLTIDVGHKDDWRVDVRVSGFFGSWAHVPMERDCEVPVWEPWKGGAVRVPEVRDAGEEVVEFEADDPPGGWLENLAPITYTLGVSEFLFRSDAGWEREYPCSTPFPQPLVFRRVDGETGEPQERVTWGSATELRVGGEPGA